MTNKTALYKYVGSNKNTIICHKVAKKDVIIILRKTPFKIKKINKIKQNKKVTRANHNKSFIGENLLLCSECILIPNNIRRSII